MKLDMTEEKRKIADEDVEVPADGGKQGSLLCSSRFGLAVLGLLCFMHNYAQRVGLSVAIVCMVNHTGLETLGDDHHDNGWSMYSNVTTADGLVFNTTGLGDNETATGPPPACQRAANEGDGSMEDGPFLWPKTTQGHILGSYFYGYLISQIPSGILAERLGPKWVFGVAYLMCCVSTLLLPLAAPLGVGLVIALRVMLGLGSGAIFPSMHAMWSRWAPPLERSRLAGITYAGCMLGSCVSLPLSGLLCQYGFGQGWDSVFYVIGGASIIFGVIWLAVTSNSPATCKTISRREKAYIMHSLKGQNAEETKSMGETPWLKMATSGPVWAIVIANFCSDWGLYTLLTNIPTFLKEVLYFDIQSNGLFSALPFIGLWLNMNISPIIADKLLTAGILSTTATRKLFNTVGMMGAAVFLVALSFVDCSQTTLAVSLLTIGVTISGCAYTGFLVNHMDIAPPYAGTLMGFANGLAAMSGFIAPYVASALTTNKTREEWQIVFYISGGVYTLGAVLYLGLGSGTIQAWAAQDLLPGEGDVLHVELSDAAPKRESEANGPSSGDDEKARLRQAEEEDDGGENLANSARV